MEGAPKPVLSKNVHAYMALVPELRLADLVTLLAVQGTGTISGAARELGVTPSQVSKAISRLERHYGMRLLSRGARGVAPTPAATRMLPRIANAVSELRATNGCREERGPEVELAVAGPSYLVAQALPAMVNLMSGARLRGFELAPPYLRAHIAENVFDVALVPGGVHGRPASWTSEPVGEIRSGLVGRPSFVKRLGSLPLTVDQVRTLPFILPTAGSVDRFVTIADDCPLSRDERIAAHEAQMVGAALEFAAATDHVVYCPILAAKRLLESGALVEIPVLGWDVRDSLYVLCNGDRVLSRTHAAIVRAVQGVLVEPNVRGARSVSVAAPVSPRGRDGIAQVS
jgi:DNA-binding transcriptional LysR family regulator